MSSRVLLALESFLALSEAMASATEAQEWESFARFSDERSALLDNLSGDLAAQLAPAEQTHARSIIEHCQQLDAQTCSRVEARQKAIRVLLQEPLSVN